MSNGSTSTSKNFELGAPAQTSDSAPLSSQVDVIDLVLGTESGGSLDQLRNTRNQARINAQLAHQAIFEPVDDTSFSRAERSLVGLFIASISGSPELSDLYDIDSTQWGDGTTSGEAAAQRPDSSQVGAELPEVSTTDVAALAAITLEAAADAATTGPFGHYREPGLVGESTEGLRYRVPPATAARLTPRLVAAYEHVHLLTFRPRESSAEAIQTLFDAGWDATGIVTLSQLAAFLHFQLRVVSGLQALAATTDSEVGNHGDNPSAPHAPEES